MAKNKDPFIVVRQIRPGPVKNINIRMTTYNKIKAVMDATGARMPDLIDSMVSFCAARLEVVDNAENEI